MTGLNRATIIGYVGRDPEIRSFDNGSKVASFSVATSETWKDATSGEKKERTEWHKITTFNENVVKVVEKYVEKGSLVGIEGSMQTRKWQDKDGNDRFTTEVVIGKFDGRLYLLGPPPSPGDRKEAREPPPSNRKSSGSASKNGGGRTPPDLDDEIPFL